MRQLALVGRMKDGITEVARKCAWHDGFFSLDDAAKAAVGVPVSHGICETCLAREIAKIGPKNDPPRAA